MTREVFNIKDELIGAALDITEQKKESTGKSMTLEEAFYRIKKSQDEDIGILEEKVELQEEIIEKQNRLIELQEESIEIQEKIIEKQQELIERLKEMCIEEL